MTKLGRYIDVIMVRPVIPHIAGIVVGYWRTGCSYRNIAREAGLHSNTAISPYQGKPAIQCTEAETCMAAKREFCSFSPNGE